MKNLVGTIALWIMITGCLFELGSVMHKDSGQRREPEKRKPTPVRVFEVQSTSQQPRHSLTGDVRARFETELAFRVGGKISQRLVDVGARVRKGDVLFRLEPEDYRLELKAAAAELAVAVAVQKQADQEERRVRTLRNGKSISESEYESALSRRDTAIGRKEAAQLAFELARHRLEYCTLVATADGLISEVKAESGQVVAIGQSVAKFAQNGQLEAVVNVPERWVSELPSSEASVTFWTMPNHPSRARLRELSPIADPNTRCYQARFTMLDTLTQIQLGMTATVHLELKSEPGGVEIPATSLVRENNEASVWKMSKEDGRVTRVAVEVVEYRQGTVLIRGGISEGDRIVSAGAYKLDADTRVRIWDELR